ncbi:uncharacterized protein N7515_003935 [Penicillium bovifimosum]|uniref:Uncharacterized protein n=1 Tax=Penicillium bovifimosum TaxID=126998 RepID=A0A9W9H5L3_9EURO|nr:uncharacterized protein N7515_003935 [Penicillium bovifimosum]KAJ5139087.1 hypothetical protein N7515_003935 [Penicillium bovifimosum]
MSTGSTIVPRTRDEVPDVFLAKASNAVAAGSDMMFNRSIYARWAKPRRNVQPNSTPSACTDRKAWKQGTAFRPAVSVRHVGQQAVEV